MLPRAELIEKLAGGESEPQRKEAPSRRERSRPAAAPTATPKPAPARPGPPRPGLRVHPAGAAVASAAAAGRGPALALHADRWLAGLERARPRCDRRLLRRGRRLRHPGWPPRGARTVGSAAARSCASTSSRGLELAPNLALTEESLLVGPGGFALLYRREDGHRAIEAVELDDSGLAKRARRLLRARAALATESAYRR